MEFEPNPMPPTKEREEPRKPGVKRPVATGPKRTAQDWIQGLIWELEESAGRKILKLAIVLMGFVLLAFWFNYRGDHRFSNSEAMESAQLGRHLAAHAGYTTYSIRPSALGLLQRADPARGKEVLQHRVPDLSIAPGYPFVLACLMKVFPFNFAADQGQRWPFRPEFLIVGFNELLFFATILIFFRLARRLFDSEVAWVSSIIFAGSEVYWKFSASGLSTMWLLLIFLLLAWCLVAMEERERREIPPAPGASLVLAVAAGALVGIGGLSRYSFSWMMIPVLFFVAVFLKRHRLKLFLLATAAFLLVIAPWIARNLALSHTPFGTAGYVLLENTRPFEEDRVQRAFDPFAAGLSRLSPWDVVNKFLVNEGKILRNDLPLLGGNWVWCFFLCSLLLPFRDGALRRLRYFLIWSLALMAVVQPLGQTHLSVESPEINSENLLILMAPLILIFGTGFFFTLLDQVVFPHPKLRSAAAVIFAVVMYAPMVLDLAGPSDPTIGSPYSPVLIQRTAAMMQPDELMMSDIPWAVAWYGERPCSWLTLNDAGGFDELERLKPVHAIYLTQRTADRPFLSEMYANQDSCDHFLLNSLPVSEWPHGAVPAGFPLTNAPPGYRPAQLFISDTVRWQRSSKK